MAKKPEEVQRAGEGEKVVRVYVDMVADLFHYGHVEFIKKARSFGNYMIVGLCSDEECTGYKRRPVLSIDERTRSVLGCRYVDEVIPNCPLRVTKEFMEEHHIDIVAHGDDFDKDKLQYWYGPALEQNKFRTVPYTQGVSTTDLLSRIRNRFSLDRPDHEKLLDALNNELNPAGFEANDFLVGHYNTLVSRSLKLRYPDDTLAITVISNNKMFDTLKKFYKESSEKSNHPVDACTAHYLSEAVKKVFSGQEYEIIYDHDKATPTSVEPKINIQTAGHVSGIAYFYQKKDVEDAEEQWGTNSIYGTSIHPVYGGWFSFRAVVVIKNIHPKIFVPKFPVDSVSSDQERIKLLNSFNKEWQKGEWRDIVAVKPEHKYDEAQTKYYHTEYNDRKHADFLN